MRTDAVGAAATPATAAVPAQRGRAGRAVWMDGLRGGAVLMVVAFHAGTLMRFADATPPEAVALVNGWLAPFRIPLLMLLSGLLVPRSLAKGALRYLDGKVRAIAWPYLVWVAVFVVVSWPPGGGVIYVRGSYLGGTWLWYLAFLLAYYAAALVLRRVPPLVVAALALAASAAAPDGSKFGERLLFLFAVFMVGVWLGRSERAWERLLTSRALLAVAAVLLVVSSVVLLATGADLRYGPHVAVTSLAGVLLLVRLARACSSTRTVALLGVCGRHSIVFYVMHFPLVYVAAHALAGPASSGALPAWAVYALLLALAVGVPAACVAVLERWPNSPLVWAYRLPSGWPGGHRAGRGRPEPAVAVGVTR